MELLLWRWSTTAQTVSALMIAVFFVVLSRSVRRAEIRAWVYAWLANLLALLVTSVLWIAQPTSAVAMVAIRFGYLFAKTLFAMLLTLGAWRFVRPRIGSGVSRGVVIGAAVYAAIGAVTLESIDAIGVAQSAIIAVSLAGGAALLVATRLPGWGWLAAGFTIRAVLGVVESLAYGTHLTDSAWISRPSVGLFLASHSSLDLGAEWMIALGCVLVLYRNIQLDLEAAAGGLIAAQERLQDLLDHDPLTGLKNRRALAGVLRAAYDTGATIIFFDLNDFKEINDSLGHQAGDECLKRFGDALQGSFRPADHVFRFAGDEFVVIAQGAEPAQVVDRLDVVRDRLKTERVRGHQIAFSAGHAYLAVHGDGEAAMKAADEAMYREKDLKPGGRGRR